MLTMIFQDDSPVGNFFEGVGEEEGGLRYHLEGSSVGSSKGRSDKQKMVVSYSTVRYADVALP